MAIRSRRGLRAAAIAVALGAVAPFASAEPRQAAGVIKQADESGAAAKNTPEEKKADTKTPKQPDRPLDTSWLAPPLPGYVLMFVLGGAVVALNLWSSKRTQLD